MYDTLLERYSNRTVNYALRGLFGNDFKFGDSRTEPHNKVTGFK